MKELVQAVETVLDTHRATNKPLAIILAGHNGSGKSTMWRDLLGPKLQIPLLNADRMMMSILPEIDRGAALPGWAQAIRDTDEGWMGVAQRGVQAFVGQAMSAGVPFAMETVVRALLAHIAEEGDRLVARHDAALDFDVAFGDFCHTLFDRS